MFGLFNKRVKVKIYLCMVFCFIVYEWSVIVMYFQVIVLDIRYYRDFLCSDGSILGDIQWGWFEEELRGFYSEIIIIVFFVQVFCSFVFCNLKLVK